MQPEAQLGLVVVAPLELDADVVVVPATRTSTIALPASGGTAGSETDRPAVPDFLTGHLPPPMTPRAPVAAPDLHPAEHGRDQSPHRRNTSIRRVRRSRNQSTKQLPSVGPMPHIPSRDASSSADIGGAGDNVDTSAGGWFVEAWGSGRYGT